MKKKFVALLVASAVALSVGTFFFACGSTVELSGIKITAKPTKTAYTVGDTFDPTGMAVTAYYGDDTDKLLESTEYEYSPAGKLAAADTKITVTYTENGVTKETKLSINVANPVTGVVVKTPASKLEYTVGETFDPTGMVLSVTYRSGDTKDVVVSDSSEVSYKTDALTVTDTTLTFTVGAQTVTQDITLLKGIYIEAETGIIDSDTFKINKDSPKASGGKYVGDMFSGDSISYKFVADKGGKADLSFRLASLYLKEDENWTPVLMGDCQFNKIVKFSVNGESYTVPDSVILPGGGTSKGEPDASLWFNWKEVVFENVTLRPDTNTVTMEFTPHDYTDTSQPSYSGSFTANVDSLKVVTSDVKITAQPYAYTVTDAHIEKAAGATEGAEETANYVVKGNLTGYEKNFRFGFTDIAKTENATSFVGFTMDIGENGDFTAVADMSSLPSKGGKTYTVSFAPNIAETLTPLACGGAGGEPLAVGTKTYSVVAPEGMSDRVTAVKIVNSTDYGVESAKLEVVDGIPFYVLEGYVSGYTADLFAFDFMENNAWTYPGVDWKMSIDETAGTFKTRVDLTKLPVSENTFVPHFKLTAEDQQGAGDISAETVSFTADQSVTDGFDTYKIFTDAYNCVGVRKTAASATATGTGASLEVAGDKVYYVLSGTYAGVSEEAFAAFNVKSFGFDLQQNPNAGGSGEWLQFRCDGALTATDDTNFVIRYDITDLAVNAYTSHFMKKDYKLGVSFDGTAEGKSVSLGNMHYELISVETPKGDGSEFWGNVGLRITETVQS